MNATATVEIPADVRDNSRAFMRIQWRSTRPATQEEWDSAIKYAPTFRYTIHQWDDTDRGGTRVTLMRVVNREGSTVDLFAAYYFTRVGCANCEYSWAERFYQYADAPEGHHPIPLCGTHGDAARRSARHNGDTLHMSEPLNIGQH